MHEEAGWEWALFWRETETAMARPQEQELNESPTP